MILRKTDGSLVWAKNGSNEPGDEVSVQYAVERILKEYPWYNTMDIENVLEQKFNIDAIVSMKNGCVEVISYKEKGVK